jgi:hypothetical protein
VEPLEYEEKLDIEETPETDRFDRKLEVSGVASRFGEVDGDLEVAVEIERSRSVLMTAVPAPTGVRDLDRRHRRRGDLDRRRSTLD